MGQKHKPFREFRTPFPLRDIRENPRSNVRACAAGDGAICSKNRKIVPYHGANPNTRNGARLRSPSPIMAPDNNKIILFLRREEGYGSGAPQEIAPEAGAVTRLPHHWCSRLLRQCTTPPFRNSWIRPCAVIFIGFDSIMEAYTVGFTPECTTLETVETL